MADRVIVAEDLRKRFGKIDAVRGLTFEIIRGSCVGLLGPNGAGKTSTMRMITCTSPLTSGGLTVFGLPVEHYPRQIKARLGVVPQEDNLHRELSVFENVYWYGRYFDLSPSEARRRAEELIAFVSLESRKHETVEVLSGGMKRRLVMVRALVNHPELLVLDEPTTGLDPQARHAMWKMIRNLNRSGLTVLLSTHYMEEAAQLCDRVLIINEGRVIADGPPQTLVELHLGVDCIEVEVESSARSALDRLVKEEHIVADVVEDGVTYLYTRKGAKVLGQVARLPHRRVAKRPATLEDLFLKLTGRSLS